jgi:crossover junction endodeoxyribonuclease RuvC
MTNILALDLGTTTGWAMFSPPGATISGTWDLRPKKYEGAGMRFVKLRAKLDDLHKAGPITGVAFEAVRRHRGTDAAHVYGGLMGCLEEWCEAQEPKVPYEGLGVGEVKKNWTGKGNADKHAMIAEARARGYEVIDDNESDALAVLDLKLKGMM